MDFLSDMGSFKAIIKGRIIDLVRCVYNSAKDFVLEGFYRLNVG